MGCIIRLSDYEKRNLKSLLKSIPTGSKQTQNIEIVLNQAEGKSIKETTHLVGVSRKKVWIINHRFEVFNINGIMDDAPRIGRPRKISSELASEICLYLHQNYPIESTRWTGTELAKRMDVKPSTMYNYLNEWGVKLDNPQTLRDACDKDKFKPIDIEGVFISPTISIIGFCCRYIHSHIPPITTKATRSSAGMRVSSFYRKKSDLVLKSIQDIRKYVSSREERMIDSSDVSIFLRIFKGKLTKRRGIFLVTGLMENEPFKRLELYCANNPRIHLVVIEDGWTTAVERELLRLDTSSMVRALKLENLEVCLKKWLDGPNREIGTFAWIAPSK